MELGQIVLAAQKLVDATAPLVGGRTINLMDTGGVIVASSDRSRIGQFHEGAARVLESREPVRIYPGDAGRYAGAKEGVNLPILRDGRLLGVVGILGDPDRVEETANLLGAYVALALEQAGEARRSALRRAVSYTHLTLPTKRIV